MGTLAVLAVLVSALLSGCGSTDPVPVKTIKVGVIVYDQYDTFISQLSDELTLAAVEQESKSGVAINLEIMDAAGSQTTQNEQVKSLIEKECDVICVNLVDRTEPTIITDMAEKNNVPIIFFNRELVEEDLMRWSQLYYVGADAFESGIIEGEIAADALKENAALDKNGDGVFQYVVLEGEAGHQDAIVRTEYSINTLVEQGIKVEKLGYAIANWKRAQAQTKIASILSQFRDRIELIIANNDDMALGAIDALKASGIPEENWPVVVGIDGTDVGLNAVKNGEMIGTAYNDKEGQARQMMLLAFELATGGDLTDIELTDGKYIRMPYYRVTAENVDEYLNRGHTPES